MKTFFSCFQLFFQTVGFGESSSSRGKERRADARFGTKLSQNFKGNRNKSWKEGAKWVQGEEMTVVVVG